MTTRKAHKQKCAKRYGGKDGKKSNHGSSELRNESIRCRNEDRYKNCKGRRQGEIKMKYEENKESKERSDQLSNGPSGKFFSISVISAVGVVFYCLI